MPDLPHWPGNASGARGKGVRPQDHSEDSVLYPASRHGARPVCTQGRRTREFLRFLRSFARAGARLMANIHSTNLDDIAARLDAMLAAPDASLVATSPQRADELLVLGEAILEIWLAARGQTPTTCDVEGFRLLALHRQGARGEPSFNACRETCRELVYHHNLVRRDPGNPAAARRLQLGAMVARHLLLFVSGKLEVAGLGEFCCSARPLHRNEAAAER